MAVRINTRKRHKIEYDMGDICAIAPITPSTLIWDDLDEKIDSIWQVSGRLEVGDKQLFKEEYKRQVRSAVNKYVSKVSDIHDEGGNRQNIKAIEQVFVSDNRVTVIVNSDIIKFAQEIPECEQYTTEEAMNQYGVDSMYRLATICMIKYAREHLSIPKFQLDYKKMFLASTKDYIHDKTLRSVK